MDIRILLLSVLLTVVVYLLTIGYRYFRGMWQWSCFVRGKYIFPKRIKDIVRSSILSEYRSTDPLTMTILADSVEDELEANKINRAHLNIIASRANRGMLTENHFKYFLLLKVISQLTKPDSRNGFRSEMAHAKIQLSRINEVVSKTYLKKAIKTDYRSIILAEIIHRVAGNFNSAYDTDIYQSIRRNEIIQRYEDIISEASKDQMIKYFVGVSALSYSPIFNVANMDVTLNDRYKVNSWIFILLFTKWQ